MTQRTNQAVVVEVLLDLVREDAPTAMWRVGDDPATGLEGQILKAPTAEAVPGQRDNRGRRAALAAWQRVTGAGPVEAVRVGDTDQLIVRGSYRGVPVTVVTIVDAPALAAGGAQ